MINLVLWRGVGNVLSGTRYLSVDMHVVFVFVDVFIHLSEHTEMPQLHAGRDFGDSSKNFGVQMKLLNSKGFCRPPAFRKLLCDVWW